MKITDEAHEETEGVLSEIEREVEGVYAEASLDAQVKLQDYMDGFARRDAAKLELVKSGEMTREEYQKWRYGQLCIGERWKELTDALAQDYTNADMLAMSVVRGHLPEVYAINANYGTYQIEHGLGVDTSWTLYDRQTVERLIRDNPDLLPKPKVKIPKDLRWNKQHIISAITQGVLQGEPIKAIAKRLQSVTGMSKAAAMRNARTAVTGAQNAGRADAYRRAEDMGIKGKVEWVSAHDGHTRESHLEVDGEQIEVGGVFSNGLAYPGDPNGEPEEVYNCRCTTVWRSAALEHKRDSSLDDYEQDKGAHNMSFDEWKMARDG